MSLGIATFLVSVPVILYFYVSSNDRKLHCKPTEALKYVAPSWTDDDILASAKREPVDIKAHLPPKTGRKYIVVGGAGFVGGWIVIHLVARGEDPANIRILDIKPTNRSDLLELIEKGVQFIPCDVTDAQAVRTAFTHPWPRASLGKTEETTVFHTAAIIRYYERHPSLLSLSHAVNVQGTQNVIDAARAIGATALVFTSSNSVVVRNSRFLLWPWENQPEHLVQLIEDLDPKQVYPKSPKDFSSNYAYTKHQADELVCTADGSLADDGSSRILRTGCLRPGCLLYGPGGDLFTRLLFERESLPYWSYGIIQNHIYVENCSIAHLYYERKLIDLAPGEKGVGGDAFVIADRGRPPIYKDLLRSLILLASDKKKLSTLELSPTAMLLLAHAVEMMYLARIFILNSSFKLLARLVPQLPTELLRLQPSMFAFTIDHIIMDDSRAREKLDYQAPWDTLGGLSKTVSEWKNTFH